MLLNDLFIVDGMEKENGTLAATLRVRFPHAIFDGHFPGRPVLPGACLVQLVQELATALAGKDVRLTRAGQVKFISMIEPVPDQPIQITVTGKQDPPGEWNLTAEAICAGSLCFRFKGTFREGSDYAA
jgi:3-hydroxyacyl-[acyl-carrier-protein] dehydratase